MELRNSIAKNHILEAFKKCNIPMHPTKMLYIRIFFVIHKQGKSQNLYTLRIKEWLTFKPKIYVKM